jgi:arylsulfatase A
MSKSGRLFLDLGQTVFRITRGWRGLRYLSISVLSMLLIPSLAADSTDRPNIVLLISDDQAWYGTSVQMHPDLPNSKSDFYHTPRLEELAQQGMRFSSGYAPATVCAPTRASLQTGMSPAKNLWTKAARSITAKNNLSLIPMPHRRSINAEEITIAEVLSAVGYTTAHYGKWHIDGGGPEANGYDESDGNTGNRDADPFDKPNNPLDVIGMSNRALDFMRRADEADTPFFIQLSYYPLHVEQNASPETVARVEARGAGTVHDDALVAAITEDLDTGVGVIMDGLEELNLSDNTFLIYMGDNGHRDQDNRMTSNAFSEAPLLGAKGNVSEGGIRVPFIIRGPGIDSNSWSHVPVVGYDFFPTFTEWAEVETGQVPQGIEGGSLVSLLKNNGQGEVVRPNEGLVFHFPHYQDGSPQSAIRLNDYKLIKYYEGNKIVLFDLSKDVGEQHNLAERMPVKAAELELRLDRYLASINAHLPQPNLDFDPEKPSEISVGGGVGIVPYPPHNDPKHVYFPYLAPLIYPNL